MPGPKLPVPVPSLARTAQVGFTLAFAVSASHASCHPWLTP